MGWTHNWSRPTELPKESFARAAADIRGVLGKLEIDLAGFEGDGEPILTDQHVLFNGRKPQHCEPFEVRLIEFDRRGRERAWSFCKTERLPYDLCVQVALIVFRHHIGADFAVGSDGDTMDWKSAREACISHLGYGGDFILKPDSE